MCYMDVIVNWMIRKGINDLIATMIAFIVWFALFFIAIGFSGVLFITCVISLFKLNFFWFICTVIGLAIMLSFVIAMLLVFDDTFYEMHNS